MNGLGALGPDRFPAYFFQKNWTLVGKDICKFVLDILNFRMPMEGANNTFITLISKVKIFQNIRDFRPISLYNVIYKILAKTLANRFKNILPEIISPQQRAFVPDTLITGNIIIAYEVPHSLSTRLKGK